MKKAILILIVLLLVGAGLYFVSQKFGNEEVPENIGTPITTTTPPQKTPPVVTPPAPVDTSKTAIGKSVEGRDIMAYHYGRGATELLFVGGIHGGYEWNTALLAYEAMDYFEKNSSTIPANIKITIIPVLNPDGLYKTVGTANRFTEANVPAPKDQQVAGRFNAHTVDLNRNFDCDWQAEGKWQDKTVSGGTSAFSEPESLAMKNYVEKNKPTAMVAWYSSAGGVFSSSCHNGVLPETSAITKVYADASKYPAYKSFDFYATTGDMVNWVAKNNIPAISVLLTNHIDTEWTKNLGGIKAILAHYAK